MRCVSERSVEKFPQLSQIVNVTLLWEGNSTGTTTKVRRACGASSPRPPPRSNPLPVPRRAPQHHSQSRQCRRPHPPTHPRPLPPRWFRPPTAVADAVLAARALSRALSRGGALCTAATHCRPLTRVSAPRRVARATRAAGLRPCRRRFAKGGLFDFAGPFPLPLALGLAALFVALGCIWHRCARRPSKKGGGCCRRAGGGDSGRGDIEMDGAMSTRIRHEVSLETKRSLLFSRPAPAPLRPGTPPPPPRSRPPNRARVVARHASLDRPDRSLPRRTAPARASRPNATRRRPGADSVRWRVSYRPSLVVSCAHREGSKTDTQGWLDVGQRRS